MKQNETENCLRCSFATKQSYTVYVTSSICTFRWKTLSISTNRCSGVGRVLNFAMFWKSREICFAKISSNKMDEAGTPKDGKIRDKKPSTCRATLFRCRLWVDVSHFSPCMINLSCSKTFVADWRKLLRKVEREFTLRKKVWLCCSFLVKLTTCHATNLLTL